MALQIFSILIGVAIALQPLPPVQWENNNTTTLGFSLGEASKTIYIEASFENVKDTGGLTLIPPTAYEFAEVFRDDISTLFGGNWTLERVDELPSTGILLGRFRDDDYEATYENGVVTEEGYEIEVANGSVYIGGTGARGMFWGTRTLLQELLITNGSLPTGGAVDTPAYATRGYMVSLSGTECIASYTTTTYVHYRC